MMRFCHGILTGALGLGLGLGFWPPLIFFIPAAGALAPAANPAPKAYNWAGVSLDKSTPPPEDDRVDHNIFS